MNSALVETLFQKATRPSMVAEAAVNIAEAEFVLAVMSCSGENIPESVRARGKLTTSMLAEKGSV